MPELRDFCDRMWHGEIDTVRELHPIIGFWNDGEAEEIEEGLLYYKTVASVSTIDTATDWSCWTPVRSMTLSASTKE